MIARIQPKQLNGTIRAVPSKSQAHRLLICAALGAQPVTLRCDGISADIAATVRCLRALGADILEGRRKPADTPIAFQAPQKPLVNMKTAAALGIEIPASVRERSELIE